MKIGQPGGAGCAEIDTSVMPHVITVSSTLLGRPQADIRAAIAHEIGHRLGLAEARQSGSCGGSSTVMRGGTSSCDMAHDSVSGNDVRQVNRNAYQPSTCTQAQPQTPAAVEEDNCLDNDGDGWPSCGGDCNDSDPLLTIYCGTNSGDTCFCNRPDNYGWCLREEQRCTEDARIFEWCNGFCTYYSPILVDVAGDGFDLTDAAGGVAFDLDSDGSAERLSWTSATSDDAWLALDRNGNSAVDNGQELFGNFTPQPAPPPGEEPNGFIALAVFDKPGEGGNGDGLIDARDAVFERLLLWRDANHDGLSQPGELLTLGASGLESIALAYKASNRTDRYGNRFRYRSKVADAHGTQLGRWAWDVFLVRGR